MGTPEHHGSGQYQFAARLVVFPRRHALGLVDVIQDPAAGGDVRTARFGQR